MTAGFEKPEILSEGLTSPKIKSNPKTNKAVTSIGKNSVINRTKANKIIALRNIMRVILDEFGAKLVHFHTVSR